MIRIGRFSEGKPDSKPYIHVNHYKKEIQMGNTRQVVVGGVKIGGGAPIAIQSMSTFSPLDTDAAA